MSTLALSERSSILLRSKSCGSWTAFSSSSWISPIPSPGLSRRESTPSKRGYPTPMRFRVWCGWWLSNKRWTARRKRSFRPSITQTRKNQVHFAAGFGLAFDKFQLDFGDDFSDLVDTASFSAISSF